jgi:hypothetical protein
MYYRLTEQTKELIIKELRQFWATHPKYKDLVDNIQGKFSFDDRPQSAIIVKTGSASKVQLSADNYIGRVISYVSLAKVPGYSGLSAEWVREDSLAIHKNNNLFPSLPGVYYIHITGPEEFYLDPLLYTEGESPTQLTEKTYRLSGIPLKGSVKITMTPNNIYLIEGKDYHLILDSQGNPTGDFELTKALPSKLGLSTSYRYPAPSQGPIPFKSRTGNHTAIPGCVIGFGERIAVDDRFAVVVTQKREDSAEEYGGKWQLTVDLDITARDVYSQQEIADKTLMFLWTILRPRIAGYGVDITEISMGGESEEIYDENGDDYFYNSAISLTLESDWSLHSPLHYKIRGFSGLDINLIDSLGLEAMEEPQVFSKLPLERLG